MPYDELVITRRLYRSGESEYRLNNEPTLLFDIALLLARANSSLDSYSIIGQGMIDRLILQTPAERLTFFDEASGIKELQLKRHQASLKLSRTIEHMREAEILLSEVAPRSAVRLLDVEPAVGAVRLALAAARGEVTIPSYV